MIHLRARAVRDRARSPVHRGSARFSSAGLAVPFLPAGATIANGSGLATDVLPVPDLGILPSVIDVLQELPSGSWATSHGVRKSMQGNKSRDTSPELALRRATHALGLRYRVDRRPIPSLNRRADLVFPTERVAVFVDGCYWHGCPQHYAEPKVNSAYWSSKIGRNVERDNDTDRHLRAAGWAVLRFWEHEDARQSAVQVAEVVRGRRSPPATNSGTTG